MKWPVFTILLITFAGYIGVAEDLVTKSGKVYKNYEVTKIVSTGIQILYDAGGATIPFAELPDNLRAKYADLERKFLDSKQKHATKATEDTKLGLSASQISRLLCHQASHFNDATWDRIAPLLCPYIQIQRACTNCLNCPRAGDCQFQDIMDEILSVPHANRPAWFAALKKFIEENVKEYQSTEMMQHE